MIKTLVRRKDLRKNGSRIPVRLMPLSDVRKATLFLDGTRADSSKLMDRARDFFRAYGVDLRICATIFTANQPVSESRHDVTYIHKADLHWTGRQKSGERYRPIPQDGELFISLLFPDPYVVEYAAKCSRALFKVGRAQLDGGAYSLVVTCDELDQNEAFDAICEMLQKVR